MGEELVVLKENFFVNQINLRLTFEEFRLLCEYNQFKIDYATSACPFTALLSLKIIIWLSENTAWTVRLTQQIIIALNNVHTISFLFQENIDIATYTDMVGYPKWFN